MSIRTLIEINHDHLSKLKNDLTWTEIYLSLAGSEITKELNAGEQPEIAKGVRVINQRHHSINAKIVTKYQEIKL